MSKKEKMAASMGPARDYVNKQLETMKQQGFVSAKLDSKTVESLVYKVARASSH